MGVDPVARSIGPAGEIQGLTAGEQRALVADGVWTWFNDRRALFLDDGTLLVGYVRGDGVTAIVRYDPSSGTGVDVVLGTLASRERDDHNNPALTRLLDGRILVVYSRHGSMQQFHSCLSRTPLPAGPADWGPERNHARPCRTTYANVFQLAAPDGRLLDFHRCIARAGRPLYEAERDYAGGAALDPDDPFLVVLSSCAREPFAVAADEHVETASYALFEDALYLLYELRRTVEGTPSEVRCVAAATGAIRPFVARGAGHRHALLWLEGRYSSYRDFSTRILGAFVRIAGRDVLNSL